MTSELAYKIALALFAYLSGSIPCGLVLSRAFGAADPRRHGSGNIGAANVTRVGGLGLGAATLAADMLKGLVPLGVACLWLPAAFASETYPAALALLVFFGNLFPVYTGFRGGGKGVATAAGAFVLIAPLAVLFAAMAFAIHVYIFRRVSIGSLTAALILPFAVYATIDSGLASAAAAVVSVFIFIRHAGNIRRLAAGSEPAFRIRR